MRLIVIFSSGSNPLFCTMNTLIKTDDKDLETFLRESNAIENEYSDEAYTDSWKSWKFLANFDELTMTRLLEVHRILLLNIHNRIAGKIRTADVRVGYSMCVSYERVEEKLNKLLEWIPKTEEEIKEWHVEYEKIHPFEDGNGRTGRIFMNWQRVLNDLTLLIIHEGEEQKEYYTCFN